MMTTSTATTPPAMAPMMGPMLDELLLWELSRVPVVDDVNAGGVVVWVLVLVVVLVVLVEDVAVCCDIVVTAAVDDGHGSLEAGSGDRTTNVLAASEMYSFRPNVTLATV